ncbi:MAG TPA: hypothetical protein PK325_13775 [Cyclobacteriaceae bacterium]|nr:hypothetical protein [Cyclobacteriaceae bacterium]HMV10862.1 hypothetical protein [Cyclobacteriaceae bacterium]HMW99697.1 hypothetical protein [Cyclobacteriaceae bacterium]HMX51985.1 hypothetical protein [Cyclobacteriaceae bacterium]HMY94174.1 hypothetical protein [Cyclobacteriaceae bacterium]
MKRLIYLLLLTSSAYAQRTEFTVHENGLIYNPETMNRLGSIVDSLNIRFRSCDLSHPYYSFPQGPATWVEVPGKQARKLIESGVTLAKFTEVYPKAVKREHVWVTKSYFKNYRDEELIQYSALPEGYNSEPEINLKRKRSNDKTSGWILNEEGTEAFWLDSLRSTRLPLAYARLVQYVDCMIDTNASIYFPKAEGKVYGRIAADSKAAAFVKLAEAYPGKPAFPRDDENGKTNFDSLYVLYADAFNNWDSLRMTALDEKMKTSSYHQRMFADAVEESLEENNSDGVFESYVVRYGSKEDALRLMRGRKVIGGCSQDMSPRYHAMNICQLAAQTAQWDIFLRSHLDIMNDRFRRMSDGSYAQAGRKTYLKELEELHIPAVDLLLGTTLRVSNVNENHYWGAINRTGRSLADANDKDELENCMITMMQDNNLDLYNRLLIAFLCDNYAYNLEDKTRRDAVAQRLENVIKTMPAEIQDVWKINKRR